MSSIPIDLTVAVQDHRWQQVAGHIEPFVTNIAQTCFSHQHSHLMTLYATEEERRSLGVALVLTGKDEIHQLNARFRGKDKPTNVLSFRADFDAHQPPDQELVIGDVLMAYDVVMEEAEAQHKTAQAHTAHMVVHGMLHLQGMDHQSEREAAAMEAIESAMLAGLGYRDPYHGPESPVRPASAGTVPHA
jgi:probable rRNA maturation factor